MTFEQVKHRVRLSGQPPVVVVGGRDANFGLRVSLRICPVTANQVLRFGVFWVLLLAMLPRAVAQNVPKITADTLDRLQGLDRSLAVVKGELTNLKPDSPVDSLQQRWALARNLANQGHVSQAAILLQDLIDSEDFQREPQYDEAVFQLALCFERSKRYEGARTRLKGLIDKGSSQASAALVRLVEITLTTDDRPGLKDLIRRNADPASQDQAMRYVIGKVHYKLGDSVAAERWLTSVSTSSSYYYGAQYYLGVIATAAGDYGKARVAFEAAANAPVSDQLPFFDRRDMGLIRDNALLALGRLHFDLGDDVAAVGYYQRISEKSAVSDAAYYELATIYSETGQLKKAIAAIDMLTVTTQDSRAVAEAEILRGDILAKLGRYEDAVSAYQRTIDRLTLVYNDLQQFARSETKVVAYLQWLVTGIGEGDDNLRRISNTADVFLANVPGAHGVFRLFSQLGEQRRELTDAFALAETLYATLELPLRLDLFPSFVPNWAELGAVDASLLASYVGLLDAEAVHAANVGTGSSRDELLQAVTNRRNSYKQFLEGVPQTSDDFLARRNAAEKKLTDLRTQFYENTQSFNSESISVATSNRPTRQLPSEQNPDRMMILTSVQAGGAALVENADGLLRDALWRACREESRLLDRLRLESGADYRGVVESYLTTRDMVAERLALVDSLRGAIVNQIGKRTAELRSTLRQEMEVIRTALAQIEQQGAIAGQFASKEGVDTFRYAVANVESLLLAADLGLVDIVWQQKQERADKVRSLAEIRAEKLRGIDQSLKILSMEKFDLVGDENGSSDRGPATVVPLPPEPAGTEHPDADSN
ncbi:MAG: tetratricopeptide repeat protein [Myxococcales bacterium]|nr:tetratricopeptide repeat protein [Myxococcales bacterium]